MSSNNLRVAVLQDDWFPMPGGGPVSAFELCKSLVNNHDVEIDIYTRAIKYNGLTYKENQTESGINIVRVPPCTTPSNPVGKFAYAFSTILSSDNSYDLIHAHANIPGVPGKILSRLHNVPVVYTVRGTSIGTDTALNETSGGVGSQVRRKLHKALVVDFNYGAVISVNKDFVERFGHHHERIKFIPNGVKTNKFNANPPKQATDFLFVGRHVGKKRIDVLIDAFEKVAVEHEHASLTIVGEGPLTDDLKQQAENTKVNSSINFTGKVPYEEMPSMYEDSHILVLPAEFEGHPRVLLEAWASSRPVIGTDVEGISEFIDQGESGWLVPYEDVDELSNMMEWCIENPDEVRSIGEHCRELIEEQYSWKAVAAETVELYESLLE